MLKHITNPVGPINGQLRSSNIVPQRSIHLRPQQPLNISTLSTNTSLQTPISPASANSTGPLNTSTCPITLLTINAPATAKTKGAPISLLNELTDNHIGNNAQHTYTNQHIYTNHTDSSGFSPVKTHNTTNNNQLQQQQQQQQHNNNNNALQPNYSNFNNLTGVFINQSKHGPRPQEALTSLGLLCLVSLLFALLSLIFLLKISPNERDNAIMRSSTDDFVIVYDVTLALCTLSLSLNLCCLLVCAIQFLFAVKLVRSPLLDNNKNKYLEKSRVSRCCAIGGFFISIPIFLTGIILYTFNHFHSTPAIITSVLIGIGIVFCGAAMVHNVFVWQKEKTLCYKSASINNLTTNSTAVPQIQPVIAAAPQSPLNANNSNNNGIYLIRPSTATPPTPKPIGNGCLQMSARENSGSVSPGISPVLDLSHMSTLTPHELSTLV